MATQLLHRNYATGSQVGQNLSEICSKFSIGVALVVGGPRSVSGTLYHRLLEPGQSTGRYTLPRSGLWIAARDGVVSIEQPGHPPRRIDIKAGDFEWHTGPVTHTITNIGKTRFEAIEAVWK